MDLNIEKECSALGGLFQQVINDMKASSPVWEDFLSKSTKLHNTLKATLLATTAFLDAFQRVADLATGSRGATREIGSALTRLCMRHRSIEAKMKAFTSCIMDILVSPMQDRMEDWKKSIVIMDKDHQKDYKKARADIKKASSDTIRLQKKVKKGNKSDIQSRLDSALHDVNEKYQILEETEKNAVRSALIEERSRFCVFISCLKPVVDEEINMLTEVTHLQEILQHLCLQASDPYNLPSGSEQVINDISKSSDGQQWSYQTPPSSPSSLGSRKSSMCSISSINSSSSGGTNMSSPTHNFRNRSSSQSLPAGHMMSGVTRLSSVSSQDSGFTSQDTLFMKPGTPPPLAAFLKSSLNDSTGSSTDSNTTTPSPSYSSSSASTWANWPDPPIPAFPNRQDGIPAERPHTISSAYEKSHHNRPSLSAQLFEPPEIGMLQKQQQSMSVQQTDSSASSTSTQSHYAVPYIVPNATAKDRNSRDSGDYMKPPIPGPKPKGKPVAPPTVPDYSVPQNASGEQGKVPGLIQYPAYVNQDDLAKMAAEMAKGQGRGHDDIPEEDESEDEDEVTTPTPRNTHRSLSMPAQEDSINDEELDISGLSQVIDEITASTAALHTMGVVSGQGTHHALQNESQHQFQKESHQHLQKQSQNISASDESLHHHQQQEEIIPVISTEFKYPKTSTPVRPTSTFGVSTFSSFHNNNTESEYQSVSIRRPKNPIRRSASEVTRPSSTTFQQRPPESHYLSSNVSSQRKSLTVETGSAGERSISPFQQQECHYHSVVLESPPPDSLDVLPRSSSITSVSSQEGHYHTLSSFMTPPPSTKKSQPSLSRKTQSQDDINLSSNTNIHDSHSKMTQSQNIFFSPTAQSQDILLANDKNNPNCQPSDSKDGRHKEISSNSDNATVENEAIKEITDSLDQTTCELTAAIKELELSTAALELSTSTPSSTNNRNSMQGSSGYGTCSDDTIASDLDDTLTSIDAELSQLEEREKYATLPRKPKIGAPRSQSFRLPNSRPRSGTSVTVVNGPVITQPGNTLPGIRRSSSTLSQGSKPPPPVRRNSSIVSTPSSKSAPGSNIQTPQDHQSPPGDGSSDQHGGIIYHHRRSHSDSESSSGGKTEVKRPTVLNPEQQVNQHPDYNASSSPQRQQKTGASQQQQQGNVVNSVNTCVCNDDHDLPPPPPPEMLAMDLAQATGQYASHTDTSGAIVVSTDSRSVLEKAHIYDTGGVLLQQSNKQNESDKVKRQGSVVNTHKDVILALNQQFSGVPGGPHSPPNCNSNTGEATAANTTNGQFHNHHQKGGVTSPNQQQSISHYQQQNSKRSSSSPSGFLPLPPPPATDYDITPTPQSPGNSLLAQIESGVKLRKAMSNDRSEPKTS